MSDIRIASSERGDCIFVSDYDDGVWLNVQVGRASAAVVLNAAQAQALIEALQLQLQGAAA